MILAYICAGWCAVILILNFTSMALMSRKCRARPRNLPPPENAPPVSIVRPLRGLEPFSEETLGATFDLDYPDYEIVFCVQSPNDPVIPLVERLIAAHPERERVCSSVTTTSAPIPSSTTASRGGRRRVIIT